MPNLALIAVIDEHENGHRSFTGLRYSAREIASLRARAKAGCRLALLSATPSLDIRQAARNGSLRNVTLPRSAKMQAPVLAVVDTTGRRLFGGISGEFEMLVSRMMREQKKVAVLASRAAAAVIACGKCGRICRCRQCAGPLAEDQQQGRCRHCHRRQKLPAVCSGCKSSSFAMLPAVSGRITQALAARIPEVRILTVGSAEVESARQTLSENGADVIIGGRELVALGPAFAAVVLADVDNAILSSRLDAATELLASVSRLIWRESGCEVLAQTRFPDHHLFEALRGGIHDSYALAELDQRRASGLPPFRRLALLSAWGPEERQLARFLGRLRQLGQLDCSSGTEIFDPVPGRLSAGKGRAQMQLLISAVSRSALQKTLASLLAELENAPAGRGLRWDVEIDPQNW